MKAGVGTTIAQPLTPSASSFHDGLFPKQTGWLAICTVKTVDGSASLPAIYWLPNHFCSEEFELFNILELLLSIRRILTPVLQPWFNITMPLTCGRATQDRHCPFGLSSGRPHFAQLCGTLKMTVQAETLKVILIINVESTKVPRS